MTQSSIESLLAVLDRAHEEYKILLESIPESDYTLPSGNEAWMVGDVLFHITLGPRAIALEAWMILHARGLFQFGMNILPSQAFNWGNALFARRDSRVLNRSRLANGYAKGHAALRSVVRRAREESLSQSVIYPNEFVAELAGTVTVERLVQYTLGHVELHAEQIRAGLKRN